MSGGRLDFGIGKGYRYNEFAGFRVPMEEADARFDECLEVILKAWTADEPFSHRGKYWEFDNIVVEPPTGAEAAPADLDGRRQRALDPPGRRTRASICCSANMLRQRMSASYIAVYKDPRSRLAGRRFDPMQVGVTRAFFVTDTAAEREAALERRLQNRVRQLKLATRPDGTVHGGPDRATGDPRVINEISAMYGSPDEIAQEARGAARRRGRLCADQRRRLGWRRSRPRKPAPLRPRRHADVWGLDPGLIERAAEVGGGRTKKAAATRALD